MAPAESATAAITFVNLFERAEGMVNLEGLELLSATQKERIGARPISRFVRMKVF